jgi:hypothetical protein
MRTQLHKLAILTVLLAAAPGSRAALPEEGDNSVAKAHAYPIPEPPTIIVGALLLLPLGASAIKILRGSNEKRSPRN